jgi:hypothetical protein
MDRRDVWNISYSDWSDKRSCFIDTAFSVSLEYAITEDQTKKEELSEWDI